MLWKAMCSRAWRLQLVVIWWMFSERSYHSVLLSLASEIREYCNIERFNASCDAGSVLLMEHAVYGRQRVGRCIQDMETQGKCGVDVLTVADAQCSGRQRCAIRLPDDDMYAMNACRESVSHLYAAYSCVSVAMITSWSRCDSGVSLSGESGFLTSVRQAAASMSEPLAASAAAAAAGRCRWNITVAPGRTVNVTLFDFGVAERRRPVGDDGDRRRSRLGLSASECQKYAVVHERVAGVDRPTIICSGALRTRPVYLSESNSILIDTFGGATAAHGDDTDHVTDNKSRFILKYQAAGCEDPVLPGGVAFRRDGNRGVMTCVNEPRVHQYIMCEENAWNGDILDCSQRVGDSLSHDSAWAGDTLGIPTTYGLAVVIVLGVVLGVIVGAMMLVPVLAYFKRRDRRLQQLAKDEMTRMYPGAGDLSVDDYHAAAMSTDAPVISKFLPLNSAESAAIVAHYDTAGRLTDVQPYTSCGGWHPAALSVVDPGAAAVAVAPACCQPSTAVRLQAVAATGWPTRRRADQEHEYELPK